MLPGTGLCGIQFSKMKCIGVIYPEGHGKYNNTEMKSVISLRVKSFEMLFYLHNL